jgi:hypothetical protein
MAHTPWLAAAIVTTFAFHAGPAFAVSTGMVDRTNIGTSPGCAACHGGPVDGGLSVAISGPAALNPGQSGTYTLTSTKPGVADGTRMGLNIASSERTGLSPIAGQCTAVDQNELKHDAFVCPLKETTGGAASVSFMYTMPAGAAPGSTRTLHAVSALAISSAGGYNFSPNFTVTTSGSSPPRLGNISTRAHVLTGNDVMIGGFVIGGSTSKTVAIVATGPSLSAHGIANPLADPTLTLVRASDQAVIDSNDNWQAHANQAQLSSTGFAPPSTLEAGILVSLPPGAYTAIVQGVGGGTGISVVGVYEVDAVATPLTNISTRARVQTGNDVVIGGFVVAGSGPQTVAIVATGPSLASHGIANPLANPRITLVRSSDQAVIDANDDWQAHANAAQLQAAGFAPAHALEAGIYTTLQPGAYTAIVQGNGNEAGVAVIGVYRVQ